MKIKISIENDGKKVEKEFLTGLKSFAKKVTNSAVKAAKQVESILDSEESAKTAGEHAENFIDKVDEFTQKAQKQVEKVIDEADNLVQKAEGYAIHVADLAKKTAEHAKQTFTDDKKRVDENNNENDSVQKVGEDIQLAVDGDNYPDEDKETLAEKIAKIPEGKKRFTLAEYLNYLYEYNPDKNNTIYEESGRFLKIIGYPSLELKTAFQIAACSENVTYESILKQINKIDKSRVITAENLKHEFNIWLEKRPDIKKYCPNPNLRQLLIYFKRKNNGIN